MLILFLILPRLVEGADLPILPEEMLVGRNVLKRVRNMEHQELPLQVPAKHHAPDPMGSQSAMSIRESECDVLPFVYNGTPQALMANANDFWFAKPNPERIGPA